MKEIKRKTMAMQNFRWVRYNRDMSDEDDDYLKFKYHVVGQLILASQYQSNAGLVCCACTCI